MDPSCPERRPATYLPGLACCPVWLAPKAKEAPAVPFEIRDLSARDCWSSSLARCHSVASALLSTGVLTAAKEAPAVAGFFEADARTRTGDPFITSEVLYQLSYVGGNRMVQGKKPPSGALPLESARNQTARTSVSNYRQWVSLAAFDGPVPCGRTMGADACRGSPRRASVAPRSAVSLPLHPRQRLHAEVGVAPVHSQVEKSCPQRFQQSPPYSRGTRYPLLPTGTSRSLRDITPGSPLVGEVWGPV
jgi:hypothetical protein